MRTRWNYWTCSEFANWLRGTSKPKSATSKGWKDWETEAKKAHPVRFWLADDVLDFLQDVWLFIPDKIYEVKCYLRNRFVDKTHALTSNLERGKWYDMDTKILNCLFDELVNFVENEKARRNYSWFEENNVKEHYPCAEAGLAHLDWEMSLKYGDGYDGIKKGHKLFGKITHQAETAKEIKELYNWWKNIYPNRPDPMEVSGLSKMYDERRKKYGDVFGYYEYETKEERKEHNKLSKIDSKIEEQYEQEDTEMLIRLMKIRKSLWT